MDEISAQATAEGSDRMSGTQVDIRFQISDFYNSDFYIPTTDTITPTRLFPRFPVGFRDCFSLQWCGVWLAPSREKAERNLMPSLDC